MSAQTVGGPKECKGQAELHTICDDKMQACNVQLDAERTPIGGDEEEEEGQQKWTLKAQAQLVMPETVESVQQIGELAQKNNRFQCQAQVEWGQQQKQQQQISIRLQGEQTAKKNGKRQQQGQQQGQQQQKQRAFLNKFDLIAEYTLKPEARNAFGRALELLKSAYFWNSQSKLIENNNDESSQKQGTGKVFATVIIDPITQKHANATIRTSTQIVRLQQIELPTQCRPFPLVRQQQQPTKSFGQLISRIQVNGRAECTVDGRRVNTFDDIDYSAPLSTNCYSVLAKDCSADAEEQPQFVVLMKALESAKQGQKKLKVISPEQQIECQQQKSSGRIVCKVNGNPVNEDDAGDDEDSSNDVVEYNNAAQTDVTVHVPGAISVRFNGRKAWLKVSSLYKNGQCGLCGHYDDSGAEENEWRMSNNENTNDLAEFHRSYALKGSQGNDGDQQCSDQELDSFYQKHSSMISRRRQQQRNGGAYNEEEEEEDEDNQENEQFNGEWNEQNEDESDEQSDESENSNRKQFKSNTIQPIKKTVVQEMNHQICFSQQTVKQCPKGAVPSFGNRSSSDDADDDDDDEDNTKENNSRENNDDDEQEKQQSAAVRFTCMSRSSPEGRRLLRQLQRGGNTNNKQVQEQVKQRATSYTQKVREPKKCVRQNGNRLF